MKRICLFLLLGSIYGLEYHPRLEYTRHIELEPNSNETFLIQTTNLFAAHFVDPKISLCFDAQLTNPLVTCIWNWNMTDTYNFIINKTGLTLVHPDAFSNKTVIMYRGVNVTVGGNNTGVSGNIALKRCKNIKYVSLYDGITETTVEQYDPWDSTIRIPFFLTYGKNTTHYVDFSSILPRRELFSTETSRTAFCVNTTVNGNIDVFMSRCKSRDPHIMPLTFGDHRQIEPSHQWKEFIQPKYKCPIDEAELPHHLHLEIASKGHFGVGEIIIYNCHHEWARSKSGDGEELKMRPVLDYDEAPVQKFFYTIMPYRRNTYFAPLKHMMDSALLFGNTIYYNFVHNIPVSVSFSACYNSSRYKMKAEFLRDYVGANLTTETIKTLSEFSRVLDCPEEKRLGFYIHFGTDKHEVTDGMSFWTRKMEGAITPTGKLRNDKFTTVAFNLNKGDILSRNVKLIDLLILAKNNFATNLNIFFNATGKVQLSVSRCKYSPRLKLFKAARHESFVVSEEIVDFMRHLYYTRDCLSDLQVERYEYRGLNRGIYLHIEPLENSVGYVAPYLTYEKKLTWHQLSEEYKTPSVDNKTYLNSYVNPEVISDVFLNIANLLGRVRILSHTSLRFYISCTGPCEFGFTKCNTDEVQEWKKMTPLNNLTYAWYTFDKPAIEYLHALSESLDCERKEEPEIVVKLKADKRILAKVEFSIHDGIDLNQVDPCHTAENVELRELDLRNKFFILVVEVAIIAVALLGLSLGFLIVHKCSKPKKDNDDSYQLVSMASTTTVL